MYSRTPLDIKKIIVLLHTLSAYSSAIKFTRLISGNVCVQAEGMLEPMKTLVLIQHHVENPIKNKIVILSCQPLLLGENYTEIKASQLKFA